MTAWKEHGAEVAGWEAARRELGSRWEEGQWGWQGMGQERTECPIQGVNRKSDTYPNNLGTVSEPLSLRVFL